MWWTTWAVGTPPAAAAAASGAPAAVEAPAALEAPRTRALLIDVSVPRYPPVSHVLSEVLSELLSEVLSELALVATNPLHGSAVWSAARGAEMPSNWRGVDLQLPREGRVVPEKLNDVA